MNRNYCHFWCWWYRMGKHGVGRSCWQVSHPYHPTYLSHGSSLPSQVPQPTWEGFQDIRSIPGLPKPTHHVPGKVGLKAFADITNDWLWSAMNDDGHINIWQWQFLTLFNCSWCWYLLYKKHLPPDIFSHGNDDGGKATGGACIALQTLIVTNSATRNIKIQKNIIWVLFALPYKCRRW